MTTANTKGDEGMDLNFDTVLHEVPGFIYLKDLNGVYFSAKDDHYFCCALDGTTRGDDLVGKTDLDFPWKKEAEMIRKNDLEVIQTGESSVYIETVTLAEGRQVTFYSLKAPLHDNKGKVVGVIAHSTPADKVRATASPKESGRSTE